MTRILDTALVDTAARRIRSGLTSDGPRLLAFALAPVLMVQGQRTLSSVPRLPEAGGRPAGVLGTGDDPVRVLVVGESTAVGVGVQTHEQGFVGELARLVHGEAGPVTWRVIGRNGARLRANPRRLLPDLQGEHDCVVVLLGVNDTLGLTSTSRWRREMSTLLRRVEQRLRPGGIVVLAGIPRLDRFPALPQPMRFVMGHHARALDRALDELATQSGSLVHVPTPAMEHRDDLAADGFHPSALGYRRWAAHVFDAAVRPWLQTRPSTRPR